MTPQAPEIENAVIGAMLIDNTPIPTAIRLLDNDSFYEPSNQKYFRAIKKLHEESVPVDTLTVSEMLKKMGEHEGSKDDLKLTELTFGVTTSSNLEFHCQILIEKQIARQQIVIGLELSNRSGDASEDIFDVLDDTQAKLRKLSLIQSDRFSPTRHISDTLPETRKFLSDMIEGKNVTRRFYFSELDNATGGMMDGEFIVIAGCEKSGKTTAALQIMHENAIRGIRCGIFSEEMTTLQLHIRLATILSKIRYTEFLNRTISREDRARFLEKMEGLKDLPIFINDKMNTSGNIENESKSLVQNRGVQLIVVDYLQLVTPSEKSDSREREVASISSSMKRIAKENKIPVIGLSQVNKDNRARESRAIEFDMDKMLTIDKENSTPSPIDRYILEVPIILRQRMAASGSLGDNKLGYDLHTGSWFSNAEAESLPF